MMVLTEEEYVLIGHYCSKVTNYKGKWIYPSFYNVANGIDLVSKSQKTHFENCQFIGVETIESHDFIVLNVEKLKNYLIKLGWSKPNCLTECYIMSQSTNVPISYYRNFYRT